MDFVIDNYLWFIIGGIVILMIIIGYFAEKTDFGKKPLRDKKPKEEIKETESVEPTEEETITEIENKGINDVLEQSNVEEDLTTPIVSEVLDFEETHDDTLPDIELPEEDLNVPFGDVEATPEVEVDDTPNIPEVVEDEEDSDEDDVWKF